MTGPEDRRDPVTSTIGFLEAPPDDVAAALRAWRAQIHGAADVEHLPGGLVQNVGRLEPLTGRVRPRELVVGTAGGRWTALFDCGVRGGDPVASVGHLSRSMGVQGVVVVCVAEGAVGVQAARQLQLFGPLPTDFLNYVRTVSVVQDGSRGGSTPTASSRTSRRSRPTPPAGWRTGSPRRCSSGTAGLWTWSRSLPTSTPARAVW